MTHLHQYTTGVPKLQDNPFYKCPSCLIGKLTTKHTTSSNHMKTHGSIPTDKATPLYQHQQQTTDTSKSSSSNIDNPIEDILDKLHLPTVQPGQHFHMDWGFVCASQFCHVNEAGSTITSIDGKNSYLLIVDRATRYMWIYLSDTKTAPVEAAMIILQEFESTSPI